MLIVLTAVAGDIRSAVFNAAIAYGGEPAFSSLLDLYKASNNAAEKKTMLAAFGHAKGTASGDAARSRAQSHDRIVFVAIRTRHGNRPFSGSATRPEYDDCGSRREPNRARLGVEFRAGALGRTKLAVRGHLRSGTRRWLIRHSEDSGSPVSLR